MILSQYHNPPYRSPTPRKSASPPPQHPSPKRKRSESVDKPLRIQTNLREDLLEDSTVSGCDSPRSKVAEKLRDLDIDRPNLKSEQAAGGDEVRAKRKRLRTSPGARVASPSPGSERFVAETPVVKRGKDDAPPEIQETPQIDRQNSSSPSTAPDDALANFRNAFRASRQTNSDVKITLSPEATPLPPSPKVLVSPPLPVTHYDSLPIPDRALSPLNLAGGDPDQASLTWQDAEITGHEIDASLGDDGLGINGIGFRPTPAMAYARSQKRKQQVSEWKAREAREARQRRMERRNRDGGGSGGARGDGEGRRVVRFEGVG